jgi:toxin ParE1/3/4
MKSRLVWTRRSLSRIEAIGSHISKSHPQAAVDVIERLRVATLSLEDFPSQGRLGRVNNTRELVLADLPYLIVYRQNGRDIEILTVMHTSQRWPKRF